MAVIGPVGEFDPATDRILLSQIARVGDTFYFTFGFTAAALSSQQFLFLRELDDPEFATDHVEATGTPIDNTCAGGVAEAWLTTGRLADLAAILPPGGSLTPASPIYIEPSRVQSLQNSYVRALSLVNRSRTHVTVAPNCTGESYDDTQYYVAASCIRDAILFKPGYNCEIVQDSDDNSLEFSAIRGSGAGLPCVDIPYYPGEQLPVGSRLYSGGPVCDELITTINGAGGPVLVFSGGPGVTIRSIGPSTLLVDINLHGLGVCWENGSEGSDGG
jgi:hypothetical protein